MPNRTALIHAAVLLAAAGSVFSQTGPAAGKDYTIAVPAGASWTDAGIDLQAGDDVQVATSSTLSCENSSSGQALPLASAPAGSLIARLKEGAAPVAAANASLHVVDTGHLFLAVNGGNCSGSFTAKVHVAAAATAGSTAAVSQAQTLKNQLGEAAQIFLAGQFGINAGSSTNSIPAPTVSNTPLDAGLRKDIDGLPRRVNDQFKNLGDMVNFVLIGSEQQVKSALDAADWHPADTSNTSAVLSAVEDTYEKKDYLAMPMSTLYLFGRPQDFGYEQAEPIAMVASRHHFRLWKTTFMWQGKTVWAGAGTHDIGFAKDKRNGNVTHKIDPSVDGERDNIGGSLQKAGKAKTLSYYLPANPVQMAKNATGDEYHSDGRILVVFLQ